MTQDRSVSVSLKAEVGSFIANIERSKLAVRDFANDAQKSATKHQQSWEKVGKGMLVTGGVIGVGVGLAVKSFMDFDSAMSKAQAGTMATGKSLDALRKAAIDAGAKTSFSATEAADAITAMGKAGVSTRDILNGGLNGALSLAAAGQLDVASASEIAATAMNQFGLEGKDIPHIADLLAAGAGKAMGSVENLGQALKFVGPVAKGVGVSIEETTGSLAFFAQQGLKGEIGGTALRSVLTTLTGPSGLVGKRMEELNLQMYDANGQFIGLKGAAGELQAKLGPLDDETRNLALTQVFGTEAAGAARFMYEGGAPAIAKWTKEVDSAGYASMQAALLTDNLRGDLERLSGSMSSVLIQSGSAVNGMFRGMVKELQGAVDLYGSLPVPMQKGALVIASVGAAALVATGGLLVLAPKIAATKLALADMGRTGALISGGFSRIGSAARLMGGPLLVGTFALGYFAKQAQESTARVDDLAASLDQQTGAVTDNTRAWVTKNLSDSGALASAKSMGVSVVDLTDAVLGNSDAVARVDAALKAYGLTLAGNADISVQIDAMEALKAAYGGGNDELNKGIAKTKLLAEANNAGGSAAAGAAGGTGKLTSAQKSLAAAATETKAAIDKEVQSLQDAGLVVLSTRSATRAMIQAQVDATAAIKKNGTSLSTNTQKGRDNAAALDNVASSALNLAKSVYAETGSEEKMRASLVASRGSLIKTYMQFDNNIGRANKYADSILKIPKQHLTKVDVNKAAADAKIKRLNADIKAIKQGRAPGIDANTKAGKLKLAQLQQQITNLKGGNVTVTVDALFKAGSTAQPGVMYPLFLGKPPGRRAGGLLDGPGSGTSDSIMGIDRSSGRHIVDVSTGEFVTNAKATKENLPLLMAINSGVKGLASGGGVGLLPPSVDVRTGQGIAAFVKSFKVDPMSAYGPMLGGAGGGGGMAGAGVQRWLPMVLQALAITGQPASMAQTLLRRMNQESGGNPNAINLWDSNAKAGIPSKGLMQVIEPTFQAYRHPSLPNDIWNELASTVASIRYTLARYGSLPAGYNRAGGYAKGTNSAARGLALVGEEGPELVRFRGGEQVVPNHKLAGGGLVGGGFVGADFAGLGTGMPSSVLTQNQVVSAAWAREKSGIAAVAAAEAALIKLRAKAGHTAAQVSRSEDRLAAARTAGVAASKAARGAEAARALGANPYSANFHRSAKASNAGTVRFLRNIATLRRGGFAVLADQLVMASDAEAYQLAEGAARNVSTAKALTGDVAASLRNQATLAAAKAAVEARYAPKTPAQPRWALPAGVAASTYGARPAPGRIQSIVVKIGDKELTSIVSATVDGHTQQLVDGLVYGGA